MSTESSRPFKMHAQCGSGSGRDVATVNMWPGGRGFEPRPTKTTQMRHFGPVISTFRLQNVDREPPARQKALMVWPRETMPPLMGGRGFEPRTSKTAQMRNNFGPVFSTFRLQRTSREAPTVHIARTVWLGVWSGRCDS